MKDSELAGRFIMDYQEIQSKGGPTIMKLVSIMLIALMMLFSVAMAENAEETAVKEIAEADINATEHAVAEEAKETAAAVSESASAEAKQVEEKATEAVETEEQKATEAVKTEEQKASEAVKTEEQKAPGFEGILAVVGLLAIALLVQSRRK
jgi:PGF-CTERM protein